MARVHHQNSLFKFALPVVSVAIFTGLMLCWKIDFSTDKGGESVTLDPLSSRVQISESEEILLDEVFLDGVLDPQIISESATPRVTPLDKISSSAPPKKDAGDEAHFLSSLKSEKSAEKQNQISGIRAKLLLKAAERALSSETPWADLALVGLSFKRAGDEKAARYWFERASRLAMDPDDAIGASRALREVVKHAVSARYFDIAVELIARIPEETEKSRARAELVKSFARSKNFEQAHLLAASLSDAKSQGVAMRSIAESEARYEGVEVALQTLQSITDSSERDRAFSSVAGVLAGMGDSDGAMSLLGQIQNTRTRDVTIAKIANIQERGGAVSIDALAGLIHDPTFRDEALRTMIVSEASRLGVDVAASSVNRIETAAGRAKAFESLVMLQLRGGDVEGALARAQSIRSEDARFRALQAVAVAEVRNDGVGSARRIANLIGDHGLRETTYGKIAQRAAISGKHEAAVATIHYIVNPATRALAFANVALTEARYGQDRSARVLVRDAGRELAQVENLRDRARTQGLMAEALAETGDASSAFQIAAQIDNSSLRDVTYQKVALSFAKVSEPDLASRSALLIERETTRERALDSVATTLARKVSFTEAINYAAQLDGHRQQVRFLLGVAGRKS